MVPAIAAIEFFLPERVVGNDELAREFPDWPMKRIQAKTGIFERHLAAPGELASDLAVKAAQKLFDRGVVERQDVDFLLFCTQTPDYILPTTACILQQRLGLPTSTGAMDFNLGCSGFVYGLGIAKGLIESGQAKKVLLLNADTYCKFVTPADRNVRTIFGDGAAATLIEALPERAPDGRAWIDPVSFGTDGRGAEKLIVRGGALREGFDRKPQLSMDGPDIMAFTLDVIPSVVRALLAKTGDTLDSIDLFVFHQANHYILEHLRAEMKISPDRFYVQKNAANTVSATVPIALKVADGEARLPRHGKVVLVGFGVGLSWAATRICWRGLR